MEERMKWPHTNEVLERGQNAATTKTSKKRQLKSGREIERERERERERQRKREMLLV
jgi:hypothetical protein